MPTTGHTCNASLHKHTIITLPLSLLPDDSNRTTSRLTLLALPNLPSHFDRIPFRSASSRLLNPSGRRAETRATKASATIHRMVTCAQNRHILHQHPYPMGLSHCRTGRIHNSQSSTSGKHVASHSSLHAQLALAHAHNSWSILGATTLRRTSDKTQSKFITNAHAITKA